MARPSKPERYRRKLDYATFLSYKPFIYIYLDGNRRASPESMRSLSSPAASLFAAISDGFPPL
jgi:hypothetical protein